MYKRNPELDKREEKSRRAVNRNWVICGAALVLAFLAHYFLK